MNLLKKKINFSVEAKKKLLKINNQIDFAIFKIFKCITKKNKVMICGNGGSAADAQHLSAEFIDRLRPNINRKPLSILNLALDNSHLTACSNDFSFKYVFSRSLEAFGKKGDILIIISTSGNSKSILEVLKKSKNMGLFSIGFLGNKGGKAKKHCDLPLIVESDTTSVIQETHIFLGHYILESVEKKIIKR